MPETRFRNFGTWWGAVLQAFHFFEKNDCDFFSTNPIRLEGFLKEKGFSKQDVQQAMLWLENASHTSDLGALDENGFELVYPRYFDLCEQICIGERMTSKLNELKEKGLLSTQAFERVIEVVRFLDIREWSDSEEDLFIEDLLTSIRTHSLSSNLLH